MKNPFSLSPEKYLGPRLWLLVHIAIPLSLLLSIFFTGPVRINVLLFDMLPQSSLTKEVMEADSVLSKKNGREIVILSAAPDFEKARRGAVMLFSAFENSADFEKMSLYFDSSVITEISQYLYDYRFTIAGNETLDLLEGGMAGEIAEDALASAFGAFTFVSLENIENDPFLLTERRIGEFLSPSGEGSSSPFPGGGLSPKEDVLAAEKDGTWYVLLRMTLTPGAISVSSSKNVIGKIYAAADGVKESLPALEFYFSGVPFHSYESSSGAQREISLISTVSLIIILFLFLFVFRSGLPVISSVLAAGVSLGLATAAALLFFREIHIITFVFGTTLIGTSVDYSVHFFVHWKGNPDLKNGNQIRSLIFKSIIMCVISSEICFFVFLFTPFPILKQFAVFSMTGLFSSFLTFLCIYPRYKIQAESKRQIKLFDGKIFLLAKKNSLPSSARIAIAAALAVIALTLLVFNSSSVKIENDLSSMYAMSDSLLESEIKAAQVLNHGSPGWYFIVAGSSPEETLENEERLTVLLNEEIARGNLESFLGTSVFAPSIKRQQKTYEAMKALLPLVPAQFEYIGFPPETANSFYDEFAAAQYCLPQDIPLQVGISNLWIGKQGENFYSCILPLHPDEDEKVFRDIAGEFDFVYFVNKAKDIGHDLDTLTGTILIFFIAAYVVISVLICCVYPWRDSLKICAAPLFLVLTTMTVLAVNKIPLGFFSAAALVLVFGLGMDYIFYVTGKKNEGGKSLTGLAVVLSFLTTLLSFGALALSSFAPAHIFGLTVSAGLSGAFIFAMLLQNRES